MNNKKVHDSLPWGVLVIILGRENICEYPKNHRHQYYINLRKDFVFYYVLLMFIVNTPGLCLYKIKMVLRLQMLLKEF